MSRKSKSKSKSESHDNQKPFKFTRAFGPPSSSSETDFSYGDSSESSYESSASSEPSMRRNTMRSDEYSGNDSDIGPRNDNIKSPNKKKTKKKPKKFSKNAIRKKTMPNESEEDSENSDIADAYNLGKGVERTNAKTKIKGKLTVQPLFIKPIYMHKLYIGNTCAAEKEQMINKLGIGTIISLSYSKPTVTAEDVFIYHYGELNTDTNNSLSKEGFVLMVKIINKSISNGNPVLIQCADGMTESIILVLFYLSTIDNGLSILQKYDWLKRKVPETEIEKDPDSFSRIQYNLNRIYDGFIDEVRFNEYCKTILENV
jgi:hypothetical protein